MTDYLIYLPFVLIGAGTLLQVYLHLSARRMRGKAVADMAGLEALERRLPGWPEYPRLVLYFSSVYCGPCKGMAGMIAERAAQYPYLLKFDAIADGDLASRLGARGAPAFVLIEHGQIRKVHLGSLTPAALDRMLFVTS